MRPDLAARAARSQGVSLTTALWLYQGLAPIARQKETWPAVARFRPRRGVLCMAGIDECVLARAHGRRCAALIGEDAVAPEAKASVSE